MTLHDFVYATYNSLLANGWHLNDIDMMDFVGFLRLRAWEASREQKQKEPRRAFIDEVWPNVK